LSNAPATTVRVRYAPRAVFRDFHLRQERWAVLVCHRRAGKTTALLADMLKRALEGPGDGRYAYCAPLYSQAKSIAWDLLLGLTDEVALKRYESELRIDLINGARIRLYGADNPDSLRGNRFDGVAIDETGDIKPSLFDEVIRPALADRKGWGVFAGTPKGVGYFRDLFEHAGNDPAWFTAYLPVTKTGLLDKAELDDARRLMSPEVYAQEFECSWTAPRSGSYYGELLEDSEHAGRIGLYPIDPEQGVHAAFDLGWRDSTAIWYWQNRPGGFAIVDHDEANGRTVDDWVQLLQAKGYRYEQLWLPHDARAKSLQTGRSTIEQLLAHKLPCRIAPELKLQQGIDAVRMVLPRCYFHEPTTHVGLRRLRAYGRLWSDKHQAFSNQPRHDENSHSADAFRYFALVARDFEGTPTHLPVSPVRTLDNNFQLNVLWEDRERSQPQGIAAKRI
jgi:phage terminase large subunit